MKKVAIVFVLVCSFLIAPLVQAQTVSLSSSAKAILIAYIENEIQLLEQELQTELIVESHQITQISSPVESLGSSETAGSPVPPNPNDSGGSSQAVGSILVTQNTLATSTISMGETNTPLLSFSIQALGADETLQMIPIDFGSNTVTENKILQSVSLVDADTGTPIKSVVLGPSTIIQSGSDYIVNVPLQIILPEGSTKNFLIEGNLYSSINPSYQAFPIELPQNSVYGQDEGGNTSFGPNQTIMQNLTISQTP